MDEDLLDTASQILNSLLNKKEHARYLLSALERPRETFNQKKEAYSLNKCSKIEGTLNKMKKITEKNLSKKLTPQKKDPCSLKRLFGITRYK